MQLTFTKKRILLGFSAVNDISTSHPPPSSSPLMLLLLVAQNQCITGWQSAKPKVRKLPPPWAVFKDFLKKKIYKERWEDVCWHFGRFSSTRPSGVAHFESLKPHVSCQRELDKAFVTSCPEVANLRFDLSWEKGVNSLVHWDLVRKTIQNAQHFFVLGKTCWCRIWLKPIKLQNLAFSLHVLEV